MTLLQGYFRSIIEIVGISTGSLLRRSFSFIRPLMDRSPKQRCEWLEQQLQVSLPEELLLFWDFAKSIRPLEPLNALEDSLGIHLVGAFEILSGKFDHYSGGIPISLHWRYSLDPPEFFTLLARGEERWHAGYYIDAPAGKSYCVASYAANNGLQFDFDGRSLFSAVERYLDEKDLIDEVEGNLSEAELEENKNACDKVRKALRKYKPLAEKIQVGKRNVVEKTIDGVGVVAAKNAVGEIDKSIKKRLPHMVRSDTEYEKVMQEAIRLQALGKAATALKLAKDLWQVGDEPQMRNAAAVMAEAYKKLARQPFEKILVDHLAYLNREWLDILDASSES